LSVAAFNLRRISAFSSALASSLLGLIGKPGSSSVSGVSDCGVDRLARKSIIDRRLRRFFKPLSTMSWRSSSVANRVKGTEGGEDRHRADVDKATYRAKVDSNAVPAISNDAQCMLSIGASLQSEVLGPRFVVQSEPSRG
jgi:hypothetical protein